MSNFKINSDEFAWSNEKGLFTHNDDPAIIIWDKTLEVFMMTLNEFVDEEKKKMLLSTFGFRLGALVSQSYSDRTDLENILIEFSDLYRNAGWGNVRISMFSQVKVVIELHNSWEQRVNKLMNKERACIFLPSLWIGLIRELLREELNYTIIEKYVNEVKIAEIELFMNN
ncbi:hypothetical protein [Paenisporosarcina sp. TG20]|uniref:hypothetical protein n=1 Tax=Paenisporosarcina sp. TG20 TaxID=1211706 RepID=UPI0003184BF9|nr:hypothetical protein [Paenisporosarcina sp. TG20]